MGIEKDDEIYWDLLSYAKFYAKIQIELRNEMAKIQYCTKKSIADLNASSNMVGEQYSTKRNDQRPQMRAVECLKKTDESPNSIENDYWLKF